MTAVDGIGDVVEVVDEVGDELGLCGIGGLQRVT
jgi:hypothetical protein